MKFTIRITDADGTLLDLYVVDTEDKDAGTPSQQVNNIADAIKHEIRKAIYRAEVKAHE